MRHGLAGCALRSFVLSLTLAGCTEGGGPAPDRLGVVQVVPGDGAAGVGLLPQVVVTFSAPLDCSTVTPGSVLLTGPEGARSATVACNDAVVTLVPAAPLAPSAPYTVTVATARDATRSLYARESASHFTTGIPAVVSVTPADGAAGAHLATTAVDVHFWDALDCTTVTASTFRVSTPSGSVAGRIHCAGTLAALVPDAPLAPSTVHTVTVSGRVRDFAGNRVPELHSTFTTGAAPPPVDAAVPNAGLRGIVPSEDGKTVYIGGPFTSVGPRTGAFVPVDAATGARATPALPQVDGPVLAIAADRARGWFIGGSFTLAGRVPRRGLAHVLADGSLDAAWDPRVEGTVNALLVLGDTLFAGGAFSSVGGEPRANLAALGTLDGAVTAWNPGADGPVNALAAAGDAIVAGGGFGNVAGAARANLVALDPVTGEARPWNPGPDGTVFALAACGERLHAGGDFLTVGGTVRPRVAAFAPATGDLAAWNPGADGTVLAIACAGQQVFLGGGFRNVGGAGRDRLAAVDDVTGAATGWSAGPLADMGARGWSRFGWPGYERVAGYPTLLSVSALAVHGDTVYAGGWFDGVSGQARNGLAALDSGTGALRAWDPRQDGRILALGLDADTLALGGDFGSVGAEPRAGVAAIDVATGALTPWDPRPDSVGCDWHGPLPLAVSGDLVYLGGVFTSVGGVPRAGLAAVDATTGTATSWDPRPGFSFWAPNLCAEADAVAVADSTVYVRGYFVVLGDRVRLGLAAVDRGTGKVASWNPWADRWFVDNQSYGLWVSGATVIVDGQAIDRDTGEVRYTFPYPSWGLSATALQDAVLYYAAYHPEDPLRIWLDALDVATGDRVGRGAGPFSPADCRGDGYPQAYVGGLATGDTAVFAAGSFGAIGDAARRELVAVDGNSGAVLPWNPGADCTAWSVAVAGDRVFAGGRFRVVDGEARRGFAILAR